MIRMMRMKEFLIGFGIAFLVLPALSAQGQMYSDSSNSYERNNNTNAVVPEGMEAVRIKGINLLVPKGTKIDLNGAGVLIIEDISQYMGRKFEEIESRLKKAEDISQDMGRKFEETDMRLKKIEKKLEEQAKKSKY
jgi:hypothetical protein